MFLDRTSLLGLRLAERNGRPRDRRFVRILALVAERALSRKRHLVATPCVEVVCNSATAVFALMATAIVMLRRARTNRRESILRAIVILPVAPDLRLNDLP